MPGDVWLPTNLGDDFTVLSTEYKNLYVDPSISESFPHVRRLQRVNGSQSVEHCGELARVQPALCFEGRALSVTVRSAPFERPLRLDAAVDQQLQGSGFAPKDDPKGNLNSVKEICEAVYEALRFDKQRKHAHGFLVIGGSTKSLKSQLARGLIHLFLRDSMRDWAGDIVDKIPKMRRPHLVTCEDDIEKYLFEVDALELISTLYEAHGKNPASLHPWKGSLQFPDYTPRKTGLDVENLEQAVDDALRMTPSVFYGGEIRSKLDWTHLYRLAQSHLVVVTTHASSLINVFEILRSRLNIQSGAQRAELASAIFGVVHLRAALAGEKTEGVVPSCWARQALGVATFTSDGLASIVPRYAEERALELPYCLGRQYFASNLARTAFAEKRITGKDQDEFLIKMAAWDLRGE